VKGNATPEPMLMIAVIIAIIGLLIMIVPTTTLLKVDRHTGYRLNKQAPDEYSGQRQAGAFYLLFGLVLFVVGAAVFALMNILT
jgi:hypothetical protein